MRKHCLNILVFMGSPRLNGNTAELCKPFMEELKENGANVCYVTLADKKVAILATHGYDGTYAFEMGVQRLCKHSDLTYVGLYSVQDEDNPASFQTEEAVEGAKKFTRKLMKL